eukprot:Sdes_comp20980_c1_seq3m19288
MMASKLYPEVDAKTIQHRFNLIGGVPRYVLENTDFELDQSISSGVKRIEISQFYNYIETTYLEFDPNLPHRIIDYESAPDYTISKLKFASHYVAEKAYEAIARSHNHDLMGFLTFNSPDSTTSILRGDLFENYAHQIF